MRKMIALLAAALLCMACAPAQAETKFYTEMPTYLRLSQTTEEEKVNGGHLLYRTYPDTANDALDTELRALVDDMAARCLPLLPTGGEAAELDVGAVISRTGTSWMSFLTLAQLTQGKETLHTEYDVRVYDVQTGERIALGDVFPAGSEAWTQLAQAVRDQLTAAFPGEEPDAQALDALCREEALREASFTLGGVRLMLTYPASAVYPGRQTLLHVTVYYPQIRAYMTERAYEQTDNSRFTMAALTYDDGGAGKYTKRLLNELRSHGATATFFLVGEKLNGNRHNLVRQQNSGYSLQYHSYTHPYSRDVTRDQAFAEKEKFESELAQITGVTPTLMRAPGGSEEKYEQWGIGYPLIHWSITGADSGNDKVDSIARCVLRYTQDGDVVLLHDINPKVNRYSRKILDDFERRGVMTVTVEELFARDGIALEPNRTYYSVNSESHE